VAWNEVGGQSVYQWNAPIWAEVGPKIFNSVADVVEWCVSREGVDYIFHYLNDFAVVGPPDSDTCRMY